MKKREFSPDLIRIVGTLFIIGVHFYYNNGFYFQPENSIHMFIGSFGRWLTFTCVPLFMVLTGYLKCEAEFSKKYYKGIIPILLTLLITSVICIAFKIFYLGQKKTVLEWISTFLNYEGAQYAWYIELYIALFLMAPFLNLFFKADKKVQTAGVITISALAFLPSILNGIIIGGVKFNFFPDYIIYLFPAAYYLIGGYIRKNDVIGSISEKYKAGKPVKILLPVIIMGTAIIKAVITYVTAAGKTFSDGLGGGYSDFGVALMTVCIFLFLYKANTEKEVVKNIASHISKRCLIIYLMSYIADQLIYPIFKAYMVPENYLFLFPVCVISVFALSLLMSETLYPLISAISKPKKK